MTVKVSGGGAATVVVVVAELFAVFGSIAVADTLTVSDKTVPAVMPLTLTTKENDADAPLAKLAVEQSTVPVPPAAGVVQANAGPVF